MKNKHNRKFFKRPFVFGNHRNLDSLDELRTGSKETQLGKGGLDLEEMSWNRPRKRKWQDDQWIEAPYPDEDDGDYRTRQMELRFV